MSPPKGKTANSVWKSKEFLAMQRKWYDKLKRDGFIDLEFLKDNGDTTTHLLRGSLYDFRKKYKPETEYYFRKARFYLHNAEFANKGDQKIWELHAEGLSLFNIKVTTKFSAWRIRKVIQFHKPLMLASTEFEQIEAMYVTEGIQRFEAGIRQSSSERKRKQANPRRRSDVQHSRTNRPRLVRGFKRNTKADD